MYESLKAIPCFTSLGEGAYRLAIVFNCTCTQEIANQASTSLDQVVENIVNKLREVTPVLRRYLPCREFLVFFIDPRSTIPLPLITNEEETANIDTSPDTNTGTETQIENNTPSIEHEGILPIKTSAVILAIAITIPVALVAIIITRTRRYT